MKRKQCPVCSQVNHETVQFRLSLRSARVTIFCRKTERAKLYNIQDYVPFDVGMFLREVARSRCLFLLSEKLDQAQGDADQKFWQYFVQKIQCDLP